MTDVCVVDFYELHELNLQKILTVKNQKKKKMIFTLLNREMACTHTNKSNQMNYFLFIYFIVRVWRERVFC